MKTLFKSMMFIAAATMAFSACNKAVVETPQNEDDFYYTFALSSPETRSILSSDEEGKFGAWESNDRLGTAIDDAAPGYAYITTSSSPVTFRIYKQGGLAGGEKIYTYYPYNSEASDATAIPFEIPASQDQVGNVFDFDAMPMVAEGFVVPAEYASENTNTEIGEISLLNLGSVIDFQVYSSNATYAAETIVNVRFEASAPISGEFTKNIKTVSASNESTLTISGFAVDEVTTTVSNAPAMGATRAQAAHIYMVVAPVSNITGSVFVTTDKAHYTFNMSSAQTFTRAGLKSFGLNLGNCQNRVAEETVVPSNTTFVFNTTEGIQALGMTPPDPGATTSYVERVISDVIVLTGDKADGSTAPRLWNNNGTYNFRVNKKNTITFSITGGLIESITFDGGNFHLTAEEGTITNKKWEGPASSVTFTNDDSDRTDINTITVSYTGGVAPAQALVMSDITCTNAEQSENSLTVSWSAVEHAEGYQVSIDGGNTYGQTQSETAYTWTGLTAGVEYTIFVKAIGNGTQYTDSEAKSQKGKTKAIQGIDVLNNAFIGVSGTNYADWSGKTGASGAVYAGNSAGSSNTIQLRSNNSNSGIVTTTSGGYAKKITVKWNDGSTSGRTLNIYGKNSAYSSASDLYKSATQGTLLDTIVYGTSTSLVISGNYQYIGIRSSSGALYLDEIQIEWSTTAPPAAPVITLSNTPTENIAAAGATVTFDYEIENPVDGVSVQASAGDADWVSSFNYSTPGKISFAVAAKTTAGSRTATITVSYTGATSKTFTITQNGVSVDGTVEFLPSDFSGQGTSSTGSEISATKSGITFECDKGYGTTEIRCYSGSYITISAEGEKRIKGISFTFSGGKDGGLNDNYTGLNTGSWTAELSSQARFSSITVTYE